MAIVVGRPPNFALILKAFPDADKHGVLFAFADAIYNPSGITIPPALIAHECVHLDQQKKYVNPDLWWEFYIADREFRYREELLAHVAEFKAQATRAVDRNMRAKLLQSTALRLVAPLYNYQPPRTLGQAMSDLRYYLEKK